MESISIKAPPPSPLLTVINNSNDNGNDNGIGYCNNVNESNFKTQLFNELYKKLNKQETLTNKSNENKSIREMSNLKI
tara:strand:+ start:1939 stop:2172 length:234 start_codon:yes stop_codon:yes gene_type:complete